MMRSYWRIKQKLSITRQQYNYECPGFSRWTAWGALLGENMAKIDRLIENAKRKKIIQPYVDYDYSKLTTEEIRELISDDITDERMNEILEPVKRMRGD